MCVCVYLLVCSLTELVPRIKHFRVLLHQFLLILILCILLFLNKRDDDDDDDGQMIPVGKAER